MKDFFISYTRQDQNWAEWIAWQLEEAKYSVILQAWDFRPGSNFVLEMHNAASQAHRTIAVLSPAYLKALYARPEWAAAFGRDPTGQQGVLLPVRIETCDLEGLLPAIIYIDLAGKEEKIAKDVLLKGIRRVRAKPQKQPPFPGTDGRSVTRPPAFPGLLEKRSAIKGLRQNVVSAGRRVAGHEPRQ
jgi:hypothetical protein